MKNPLKKLHRRSTIRQFSEPGEYTHNGNGIMFVERRLKKFKNFAQKELARTDRWVKKNPTLFDEQAQQSITKAADTLKQAMAGDDPSEVRRQLKLYKQAVDLHVPFYKTSIVREYAEAIVIAAVLALFIRSFIIQAFKIPSGSMIPTLLVGDHIVVNKFIYGFKLPFKKVKVVPFRKPERGEIVVFKFPRDPSKDFIKRVVGLPGDRIEIQGHSLRINDEKVPMDRTGNYKYKDTGGIPVDSNLFVETLGEKQHPILFDGVDHSGYIEGIGPQKLIVTVPENKFFVMGDNRDRSNDSRFWGFVDVNLIKGKAMVIYFSWPPKQLLRFGSVVR